MKELIEAACAAIGWSGETYVHVHTNVRTCNYVHTNNKSARCACSDTPAHRQLCVFVVEPTLMLNIHRDSRVCVCVCVHIIAAQV